MNPSLHCSLGTFWQFCLKEIKQSIVSVNYQLYPLPLYWFTLSPGSFYAPLFDSETLLFGNLPLHWAALLAGNIPALPSLLLHHRGADLLVERPADLLQD